MKIYRCQGCSTMSAGGKKLPLKCPKCHRGPAYLLVIGKV